MLESRNDGWIRLRWAPDSAGVAWTHSCLLSLGRQPLVVQTWAELFESFEDSPMYFRSEVRHSLRTGASIDSARIGWVPASPNDYHLEPLEIRGDWMRVELVEPSDYCAGPDAPASTRREGWVKWRDDEIGPWVWYYTRGC